MVLLHIVFVLLIILAYRSYAKHKRYRDLINMIPGPPTLPIIGNLLMFNACEDKLWDVLRYINREYYPITRFWLGPIPVISTHNPDDIEIILTSEKLLDKGYVYKCLSPWLKTGLLTSSGSKWQHRRKILGPAFHFQILQKYVEIMNDHGKKFVEQIANEGDESIQCLIPVCSKHTLNIICESAMGVALDKIDTKDADDYSSALEQFGTLAMYRALRPYILDCMMIPLLKIARVQKKVLKSLHNFTNKVLLERKEYHKRTGFKYLNEISDTKKSEPPDMIGRKKKLVMLDSLLLAEKEGLIDDNGIKEELDTFMFAGHDTTGISLVYTIMLLAENRDIQEKARAEVSRVLYSTNGEVGTAEIQELQYLERCIKESLRLFPPASAFSRAVKEDIKLTKYTIPAGTEIGVHIFDLHRDPNLWAEPTKYDPDRFLPENIQGRHPYSYLPFSSGPRNCIGQKFAMMELKCLLALILHNFELEPISRTSDIRLYIDLVTRPSKPVYTKFIRIHNDS